MGLQIKFTVFASLINFCVSLLGPASVLSAQEFENQNNSIFRKYSELSWFRDPRLRFFIVHFVFINIRG